MAATPLVVTLWAAVAGRLDGLKASDGYGGAVVPAPLHLRLLLSNFWRASDVCLPLFCRYYATVLPADEAAQDALEDDNVGRQTGALPAHPAAPAGIEGMGEH